jgi:hypothetical protein
MTVVEEGVRMGIVIGTLIYKAGKRRANKKRDKQDNKRIEFENWGNSDEHRAMYEYYNGGDTSARDEYDRNK